MIVILTGYSPVRSLPEATGVPERRSEVEKVAIMDNELFRVKSYCITRRGTNHLKIAVKLLVFMRNTFVVNYFENLKCN